MHLPAKTKVCATCANFSHHEPARKEWGDCLHDYRSKRAPLVLVLKKSQHRDNGGNCPGWLEIQRPEVRTGGDAN